MNTIESLYLAIDKNPEENTTRMVLADALAELDPPDPLSFGYRIMGQFGWSAGYCKLAPASSGQIRYIWGTTNNMNLSHKTQAKYRRCILPDSIFNVLVYSPNEDIYPQPITYWKYYFTRRDAEAALAYTLIRCPDLIRGISCPNKLIETYP